MDKRIALGVRGPVTVVTGPPGAGKTVAIASWAASERPAALGWLTLDRYDNRPEVFWPYAAAALRRAGVSVPAWPGPGGGPDDRHGFLLRLAAALEGTARESAAGAAVLVLDDLHVIKDRAVTEELAYVLASALGGLRLVIAARADPLLPLHRYRAAGELTEIRADDLAFTSRESALLLGHHDVALSAAALDTLTERTEGWAAGVRLAALSLQGHPDPGQFVKELGAEDSALTGYLVDEVLNAQPPAVRAQLLQTSILHSLTADLVSELTGDPQAGAGLAGLARSNAFIRPIGHGWYRYHALFASVLRLKLRREYPGQLPGLNRRAARWYQRSGRLPEAVRHAADAGDWALAGQIVVDEFAISALAEPSADRAVAEIMRRMPASAARGQLHLLLAQAAIELSDGATGASQVTLAGARRLLRRIPGTAELPARMAEALLSQALGRRAGDLDITTGAVRRAELLLARLPGPVLARHPGLRARVLAARGLAELWSDQFEAAVACFAAGVAAAYPAGSAADRAECLGWLALLKTVQGQPASAAELLRGAADLADSLPAGLTIAASPAADIAQAFVHLQQAELTLASVPLRRAEGALRASPDRLASAVACLVAAQLQLACGRPDAAAAAVAQGRADWAVPGWLELELTLMESRVSAAAGEPAAAAAAARRARLRSAPAAAAALAQLRLGAGDLPSARQALRDYRAAGPAAPRTEIAARLAEARLGWQAGDPARARRALEQALRLAEPQRFALPFALEEHWIGRVLSGDPGLARRYAQALGRSPAGGEAPAARPAGAGPAGTAAAGPPLLLVDPLSPREQEILRQLADMLSTAEIATELYISVNTVKTHLRSIYRKLSARHRGEAVRRARQLKLI